MESRESSFVLGQRYTLATLAIGLALLSFLNLAGLEKAVLAIVLGLKALKTTPEPALERRRGWARFGIGLALVHIVVLISVILFNLHRLPKLLDALRAISDLQ
jgi:hypothetical protein